MEASGFLQRRSLTPILMHRPMSHRTARWLMAIISTMPMETQLTR